MPGTPGVQGGAGHLTRWRRLPLGHALGAQRTRGREAIGTCAATPTGLAVIVALWRGVDDGSHRDLLGPSLSS